MVGGNRERDLFPLPCLRTSRDIDLSLSRSVRRRILRRLHVQRAVNKAVTALNSLYTGGGFVHYVEPVDDLGFINVQSQREALANIIKQVKRCGAPPLELHGTGALQALRAASSPYQDSAGIGDVVPMKLGCLSIPSMKGTGVEIERHLDGAAGACIREPSSMMLQDAANWGIFSEEAAKIKTYNDPMLRNKTFFLEFLRKLDGAGILSYCHGPRGRVGAFCVSKKPKEIEGIMVERQRLILDCRRVNLLFRAPPVTELGSLPAVGDLHIPEGEQLFISGGDIKDCFYACKLPQELQEYFALSFDVSLREAVSIGGEEIVDLFPNLDLDALISPCLNVLPMGFSWSFYLVQSLHVQACIKSAEGTSEDIVLDSRPAPTLEDIKTIAMPYCDNTHVLSLRADSAQGGQDSLKKCLEEWGFEMHEELGASTFYPTLGGVIDGAEGTVRPNHDRFWNISFAFQFITKRAVSSDLVQRLLGHAMVILVLNRAGMGVFRSLYDFAGRGFQKTWLWPSAKRECLQFVGILPLLFCDMRMGWSNTVFCTDASPSGFGICERQLDISEVASIGSWHERWRYKRTSPDEWNPRQRALGLDPFSDISTACSNPHAFEWADGFSRNEMFEEVPQKILDENDWHVAKVGLWKYSHEHITLKEARTVVLAIRRATRTASLRGKKLLLLVDNLALALMLGKGRSSNYGMLRVAQKIGALLLAGQVVLRVRWIPSEWNISDGPSRGSFTPGFFKSGSKEVNDRFEAPKSALQFRSSSTPCSQAGKGSQVELAKEEFPGEEKVEIREKECGESASFGPGFQKGGYRKESSKRSDEPFGGEFNQHRAADPIWLLHEGLQGVVQGERLGMASKGQDRRDPRRLLRRAVFRRKVLPRGGKDTCSFRIQSSKDSRNPMSSPSSTEGMAKTSPSEVSPPLAQDSGIWNSNEAPSNGGARDGAIGLTQLRCLSSARRSSGVALQKPDSSSGEIGKAVSDVYAGLSKTRTRRCPTKQVSSTTRLD